MDQLPQQAPRRRATHLGYVETRRARSVVRDLQEHLSAWQRTAANLRAATLFGHADSAHIRDKAAAILTELAAARHELATRLTAVEPGVARHSLPRDIGRSLDRLQIELQQLIGH